MCSLGSMSESEDSDIDVENSINMIENDLWKWKKLIEFTTQSINCRRILAATGLWKMIIIIQTSSVAYHEWNFKAADVGV